MIDPVKNVNPVAEQAVADNGSAGEYSFLNHGVNAVEDCFSAEIKIPRDISDIKVDKTLEYVRSCVPDHVIEYIVCIFGDSSCPENCMQEGLQMLGS